MGKSSKKNQKVFNAFDLLAFAWEKKLLLIGLTTVAAIMSIIISLSMPDRFKSTVVLFPAAPVSVSKNLVETSSISMDSRDILSFGREEDAERMLQILHSNQIKDYIVNKYGLMKHYEIDEAKDKFPYTKLDNKYKGNIKFRRTQFQSIEITVFDEDKAYAANIANDIAAYIDSAIHNMQKERAIEAMKIVEKEYNSCQSGIEILNDSIQKIRQLGIIDYQSQAVALNQSYADALARGNSSAASAIQNKMNVLARYGGIYVELSKKLESEIERLGLLNTKYAAAKVNVEQTLPQIFIVDKANESERKAEPKRSIIVIISTMSAFFLSLLILLIIDNVKARL
ncbi:MAG: hypothetical protein JXB34_01820 [Bacteroidales bacterium]|nr:hypothetical protein [Bacteroidales bacterium]